MISARVRLTDYSNKVLNVIKAKYDLRDKSEAINKLIEIVGDEIVEKEASDEYLKKIIEIDERHMKKYGDRHMTLEDLDRLCGVE